MADLWADDGFGGGGFGSESFGAEDDWDEGEESLETDLEEGFDDPDDVAAEDDALADESDA